MFFRFGAALLLAVLISMVGIAMEKQTLEMKRAVSRQYFQMDLLLEMHARLRLSIQRLTAPAHLQQLTERTSRSRSGLSDSTASAVPSDRADRSHRSHNSVPAPPTPALPLLRWERPTNLRP